jgi:putative transposase
LTDAKIKISMDGKGAWRDNRMIERLWRSLKYECVYLNAFETGSQMRAGIAKWLTYYNSERPHSTHGILTPDEAVNGGVKTFHWGGAKAGHLGARALDRVALI